MGKFIDPGPSQHTVKVVNKHRGKASRQVGVGKHMKNYLKRRKDSLKEADDGLPTLSATRSKSKTSEFQNLNFKVVSDFKKSHLQLLKPISDIFAADDLKANYEQVVRHDLMYIVFDEIALEGLCGITIEALWKRIQYSLKWSVLPWRLKEIVWKLICLNKNVYFYQLPEERADLKINMDFSSKGGDTDLISSRNPVVQDLYKAVVPSKGCTEMGSCPNLTTRKNITDKVQKMSLMEVVRLYKNKLVIVGSEALRKNALFDIRCDPCIELVPVEYCLLEWIGRMRDAGEITLNLLSSTSGFNMDARSLFHHCKILRREHLAVRQSTCFSTLCFDQKAMTRLITLRRFYQRKKSEHLILMESIVNYLKNSPQCRAQTSELRKLVGPIYSKLLKSPEYGKYIDSHIVIPYSAYYKNSQFKEYMTKSKTKERTLKMSQLKDPHVNIVAVWDEKLTPDSSDEEDDDEETQDNLNKGRRVMNKEFITVVYQFIASKGSEGATTSEVRQAFDGTPLYMRLVLNKLMARKLVDVRKFDFGKVSINKYVAKLNDSKEKPTEAALATPRVSSVLEKMKQKQRQKVKSLPLNRVYSADQCQPPFHQFSAPKLELPQITFKWFSSSFTLSMMTDNQEVFMAKFTETLKPFHFNLQTCKVDNVLTYELPELTSTNLVDPHHLGLPEPSNRKFKSDNFTKAFLLRALLDNFKLNSVADFLDPKKTKKAEKRPASEPPTDVLDSKIPSTRLPPGLLTSLGVEFKLALREEIKSMMFLMEVYESVPLVQYKTGDISQYKCSDSVLVTDRFLGRIRLILKTIQEQCVLEDLPILLKIVVEEESKTGYDKKMDRKSLHRLIKKITDEGYIKLFHVVVSRADYKRNQTFVCHPIINLEHYKLKESLLLLKEKTLAYVKKAPVKTITKEKEQKSPFTQDDVLSSLYEVKMFMDEIPDTVKLPRKVLGKHFGLRPKFARLALIHEFLFYIIYELDKSTRPLSKTAVQRLFNEHKLSLTAEELDILPPVYANEISWKTFVSPLPHHQNWDDGWALLGDIVLRFPIILIFRSHAVNFTSTEQQEVVNHPYKRFFLAKNVSASMRQMIMHKRKFIADLAQHITLLGFCGLVQKGPYAFHDKDRMFFYLNRRATLWDTTSSKPSCLTIEDKEYPKMNFYFKTGQDVIKYWSTMNSICIRTNLNLKNVTNKVVDTRPFSKLSLESTRTIRTAENVKKFDTGELPGDHKGAAGLDSSLFAHRAGNWTFFASKSTPGEMESLLSLKLEKVEIPAAIVQTKKPPKYYIAKSSDSKQTVESGRKKKVKKFKLFAKNTKPPVKRLLKKGKEIPFDAVDLAIMRRGPRYHPKWTDAEDRLLILLKIASFFVTPGLSHQKVHYSVLRDILHTVSPKSRDKSSRTVSNRLRLRKGLPVLSNLNNLLPNLSKLPVMAQYFFPLRSYIAKAQFIDGHSNKSVLSESELKAAFVFLAYYFVKNQKEVEVALHGSYTTLDYFNDLNRAVYEDKIEPFYEKKLIFDLPTCEADITKNTLKNTIICALGHRDIKSETCLHTYKIYQQYNQDVLKSTLNELKSHRMIQTHKKSNVFFGRYRLSAYYVFSNSTTFWNNTMETAYETFLGLKHRPAECDWNLDSVNAKNYGRFFGFNEVMSFMMSDATLRFHFPKYHLVLNPDMEDHDEIVEELARRYQAKLKSQQQKTSDSLKSSSTRLDIEDYDTDTPIPTNTDHPPLFDQLEEIVISDDVDPLDLSITAQSSSTIDNLKHWISDCIDAERVRSPSPELLTLEIKQEPQEMDEGICMSNVFDSSDGEVRLLTLEEIKEGMLKPDDETGKREVPYISDLTKLLTVIFEDRDCDERASYLMKKHFIQKYPTLEDVQIDDLSTNYLSEFLERRESIKHVWAKAEREAFIETPDHVKALSEIHSLENAHLADEILRYIEHQGPLGAPGHELKECFLDYAVDELQQILKILLENHIILKTGVTQVVFVHYKHQNSWLTNTFHPKTEEVNEDNLEVAIELNALNTDNIQWYKIKPLPWINLEGTLDRDLFKLWLSQVFSYCIENPKIPLVALCDKFCFLKPVDVFYLLEVLEEIGAVEIRRFPVVFVDLFSEYVESDECKGTALDRFDELFVETNNVSFTALGSFFHNCKC